MSYAGFFVSVVRESPIPSVDIRCQDDFLWKAGEDAYLRIQLPD